jgi:hypothetical protein
MHSASLARSSAGAPGCSAAGFSSSCDNEGRRRDHQQDEDAAQNPRGLSWFFLIETDGRGQPLHNRTIIRFSSSFARMAQRI